VDNAFRTTDFDFEFPPEAVAQHPLPERSSSRLLVVDRDSRTFRHRSFHDFPDLFAGGDVIVVNTSRVIPARLRGTRQSGSEAEVLLVHPEPDGCWLAMVRPGGKLKPGRTVHFGSDARAEVVDIVEGGLRRIRFSGDLDVAALMERYGTVPLPPYITRSPEPEDRDRYQTVYAEVEGSVAAPTAGLHFTNAILREIAERGVELREIVLHVGPGTFRPVEVEDPSEHAMHVEWYSIPASTAKAVNAAKAGGGRVWAVGTTVARTLETAAADTQITEGSGWSDLFIFPPFEFKIVDALLTNFHLPRSTLLMLVAAFAGRELTLAAYRDAVASGYRLFSYGDAMAVI
jgi:S-adenosylmethionine:tRNA ribosyltransferase-isomerase